MSTAATQTFPCISHPCITHPSHSFFVVCDPANKDPSYTGTRHHITAIEHFIHFDCRIRDLPTDDIGVLQSTPPGYDKFTALFNVHTTTVLHFCVWDPVNHIYDNVSGVHPYLADFRIDPQDLDVHDHGPSSYYANAPPSTPDYNNSGFVNHHAPVYTTPVYHAPAPIPVDFNQKLFHDMMLLAAADATNHRMQTNKYFGARRRKQNAKPYATMSTRGRPPAPLRISDDQAPVTAPHCIRPKPTTTISSSSCKVDVEMTDMSKPTKTTKKSAKAAGKAPASVEAGPSTLNRTKQKVLARADKTAAAGSSTSVSVDVSLEDIPL